MKNYIKEKVSPKELDNFQSHSPLQTQKKIPTNHGNNPCETNFVPEC